MSAIMGKFEGIRVYKTTLPEYVNMRLYKDEENIYVIDDDMIYKNEIFAKWDGNYVTELDPHERAVYYTIPKEYRGTQTATNSSSGKAAMKEKNETKKETEPVKLDDILTGVYEINYANLFADVDMFLKML